MFRAIVGFEFRYQLKSPVFLVTFVFFFLLAFGAITSENIQIGGVGNVHINSPFALTQTHVVFSFIAMFIVTAFLANIVLRDVELRTAETFFTTRIRKGDYLFGRFLGAYAVSLLLLAAVPLGTFIGTLMPWLDPERLGPFSATHYVYPFLVIGALNLLFAGALAFALATLSRSMGLTYVGIVAFFLLYGVTQNFLSEPAWRATAALFDPFGGAAFQEATRYWTAFERNGQLVPLAGDFLLNRLLWLGVSLTVIALTAWRFRFEIVGRSRRWRRKKEVGSETPSSATRSLALPPVRLAQGTGADWLRLLARTRLETGLVVKSIAFPVLVALALISTGFSFYGASQFLGTDVYPVTRALTNVMQGTFTLSLLIVVVYYSAELVWREREAGLHEVIDATPVPGWVFAGSKMLAVLAVVAILLASGVVFSVLYQLSQGYTKFEWGVYLTRHMLDYGRLFYVFAIFGVLVQCFVPNKFVGMGVMVAYIVSLFALDPLGFEDPLYRLGDRADVAYSDMNGWGHFAEIALSYGAYWASFCLLFFVLAHLFWRRGAEESLRLRFGKVRRRLRPAISLLGVLAIAAVLGTGGYIWYNTHILNTYRTADDIEDWQVAYEKRYRPLETVAQPRITGIEVAVDLYPDARRYEARGSYRLENRTDEPVSVVHVGFNQETEVRALDLDGAVPTSVDAEFNVHHIELATPMAPGEVRTLHFETARAVRGFRHARNNDGPFGGGSVAVVSNGTLLYGGDAMPYIGFTRQAILTDRNKRRKHGLPDIERYPDLDDAAAARNSYLSHDADWVRFRTTVSTSGDQIAVAPGYPVREWTDGGRRYVTYEMDAPMQNLVAWLSGRYERRHAEWNGVSLDVYYHPGHPYNVDKMLDTMKKALAYYSASFSPYQYRQMRILEFPAFFGNFAQSFPNTIQWSEGLGFIARVDEPTDIDYVFYVGAHEMAHQWWGHQLSSADVQGQTVLVETLAQYSALMVMEHEYGPDLMRRFLKYELDNYLSSRGQESREEMPLLRVENQPYIHYRKGSLVMYALKDYLGEARVNRALAALLAEKAYQYDPYPRSVDLERHLKAVAETPDELALIEDLFERITLFDLKVTGAEVTPREDGRFDVTITVAAKKLEADGLGRESERPLDMMIDIGAFTVRPDDKKFAPDAVLHLAKHRIRGGENTVRLVLDRAPAFVGVDPYVKLIDRDADDNVKATGSS
ncbi:MAG: hypothetical protein D6807_08450, partial [Alphaproteobacteria bacterium]